MTEIRRAKGPCRRGFGVAKRVMAGLVVVAAATGCARDGDGGIFKNNSPTFDGQQFRGSVNSERTDRQNFTVTIQQVSKSAEGAVAAAVYRATQHCIEFYGTSDIDWVVGPESTPLPVAADDSLTLRGSCRDI